MPKLGRNDLCWCGSGRKYKRCHLGRSDESPLPLGAIASDVRRASAFGTCLHPHATESICGKVVSAHTLQRARVLAAIADETSHVLTFYPAQLSEKGLLKLHRRGWRKSSTFDAFCAKHDAETFAPLETVPFDGTQEQRFLIAYRAICWELYQKKRAARATPTRRRLLDRGATETEQHHVQRLISLQDAGFKKGLAELSAVKARMDATLISRDFSTFDSLELSLDGPLGIASTGAITPNRTLSGHELQTLHKDDVPLQWLAFGVDLRASLPSAVFVWLRGDDAPKRYLDEMLSLAAETRAAFLAQFFFAHCENTYFSAAWWSALTQNQRDHMEHLMRNSNPYYVPPVYDFSDLALSPWIAVIEVVD